MPRREDLAPPVQDDFERTVRNKLRTDYHIEALLGSGGMSVVYLARDLELKRPVALKVLPLQLSFGGDAGERFTREAQLAASLDHPNIVPVYRIGATSAFMWYSMKYVSGLTLSTILEERGRLDVQTTVGIIEQVGSALQYAHRRGVVHRDIKPGNVIVDDEGWVVVCDFGIAKAFGAVPLTQTGSAMGTPAYMAPEQCYGIQLDGRADLYALAVVAYECLAGAPPFVAQSLAEYVRLHCSEEPPPLTDVCPDVPRAVADTIHRALLKRPEDRFADVASFVTALGGRVRRGPGPLRGARPHASATPTPVGPSTLSGPTTPVTLPPQPASGKPAVRRRITGITAAGAVALLVVALLPSPSADTADAVPETRPESPSEQAAPLQTDTNIADAELRSPAGRTAARPAAPPTSMVRLFISTQPWGTLYIDGERIGTTPTPDGVAVAPGLHLIRVVRPGHEPYEEEIDFEAGRDVRRTRVILVPSTP